MKIITRRDLYDPLDYQTIVCGSRGRIWMGWVWRDPRYWFYDTFRKWGWVN